MNFINLWCLALFPAIAIPLLIHWLVNRRRVVIRFAAFEWMLQAMNKRKKVTRVNEVLKLVAKTLLVLLLLLFIARPVFRSFSAAHILIVIDNSISMGAVENGTMRFETAKSLAKNLTAEFPDATLSCFTWNTRFEPVAHAVDANKLSEFLDETAVSGCGNGSTADFFSGIRALEEFNDCDTVCFISDFQSSQYQNAKELADHTASLRKHLLFMPVVPLDRHTPNVSLESFSPAPEGFYPGRTNRMIALVRNNSQEPVNNLPVVLLANGEKRDMAMISIPAGNTAEAHLTVNIPTDRDSLLEIRLPPDALLADNTLMLNAYPSHDMNILGIVPQTGPDADYRQDVFIKTVISAISDNTGVFHYTSVTAEQALNSILDNYDLILTFGISFETETSLSRDLNEYRKRGKSVISFASGESRNPWKSLGVDVDLIAASGETYPDEMKLAGTYLSFMENDSFKPELFTFRKAFGIKMTETDGNAQKRLFLKNSEHAAILKITSGRSSLILCGFLPDLSAGSFVHNPNFVQFIMRMLADAIPDRTFSGAAGNRSTTIRIPDRIELKDGTLLTVIPFAVSEKASMPPKMDGIVQTMPDGAILNISESVARSAAYEVLKDRETLFRIALNPATGDSDLAPAPPDIFSEAMKHGLQVRSFSGPAENGVVLREYFLFGLILLGLALLFDFYVHFMRRR